MPKEDSIETRIKKSDARRREWASGTRKPNMAGLQKAQQVLATKFEAGRPADQIRTADALEDAAILPFGGRFCLCEDGCGEIVPLLARERFRACPECREVRVERFRAERKMAAD